MNSENSSSLNNVSFGALPSALESLTLEPRQPRDLVGAGGSPLSSCTFQAQEAKGAGLLMVGEMSMDALYLISIKSTPLQLKYANNGCISVGLSCAGDLVYQHDGHCATARPGDLLLCPNNGGLLTTDLCSVIIVQFEPKQLLRRIAVLMGYEQVPLDLSQAHVLPTSCSSVCSRPGGLLRDLCDFLDRLLEVNELLPKAMGLEEQFYRSLALEWLHANGHLDDWRRLWHPPKREAFLDALVDFIMANLDRRLTLADLQEQSHYSGRQLQYVFRRKFDCTPLQFVRRQRLTMAMARLDQAQPNETITQIARDFGYRNPSSFSADFFRQFGTYPSLVLRSRRQRSTSRTSPVGPGLREEAAPSTTARPALSRERTSWWVSGLCAGDACSDGDASPNGAASPNGDVFSDGVACSNGDVSPDGDCGL